MLIGGKEYKLRYNVAGEFAYEKNTGHRYPYGTATLFDEFMLFYAMLCACNDGFDVTFDDFINYCNDDPTLIIQFRSAIAKAFELMLQFKKKLEMESKANQ